MKSKKPATKKARQPLKISDLLSESSKQNETARRLIPLSEAFQKFAQASAEKPMDGIPAGLRTIAANIAHQADELEALL